MTKQQEIDKLKIQDTQENASSQKTHCPCCCPDCGTELEYVKMRWNGKEYVEVKPRKKKIETKMDPK